MKTNKTNLCICMAAIMVVAAVFPGRLNSQTASIKSADGSSGSGTQWSVEVERVEPGEIKLDYPFQVATYESLLADRTAGDVPNLLLLKTTVVKYTQGSETRRAVTTFSGATKLSVRSQLVTREGKIVLDRTVNGDVRFFGNNLRATHNLARNIAKMIKESPSLGSEQHSATVTGQQPSRRKRRSR